MTGLERQHFKVAPAQPEDAEAIAHIIANGFRQTYARRNDEAFNARLGQYAEAMETPRRVMSKAAFILHCLDDPDRGYFKLLSKASQDVQGVAYAEKGVGHQELVLLYVKHTSQRQGGGATIMRHLIGEKKQAREGFFDDRQDIELGVEVNNAGAQRMYERFGFKIISGSEHDFDGIEGMRELRMVRKGDVR